MKIEQEKTQYIIVAAFTSTDWDDCSFVLVHLTEQNLRRLQERSSMVRLFDKLPDFYFLSFWDRPLGWFKPVESYQDIMDQLWDGELDWAYVSFEDEAEISSFPRTEQKIEGVYIQFLPNGYARFKGTGSHTSEQFWSAEFCIDELSK